MVKYFPFITGTYSTAPGLKKTDQLIFQIDDQYEHYLSNKEACRKEDIHKYYKSASLPEATIQAVNRYIVSQLIEEYPNQFELADSSQLINRLWKTDLQFGEDWLTTTTDRYVDLFDGLCSQVQEDLAVFQLTGDSDYLAAVHLCAPNHWSPGDKVGKPFDAIHRPVADMEKTIKRYPPMLKSIVKMESPFTRFAWGIGTDTRLNHHPEAPVGIDKMEWAGRVAISENDQIYLRVERQNLIGFKEQNAFLFTIRTYHYSVEDLTPHEKQKLWESVQSMSPATLEYKGLNELLPELERRLS